MLSKADLLLLTLFGTHRYAHFQWDWPQHSYSIRHAQNCTCQLTLKTSRSLFEMHKNAYVKRNCLKSRTLFRTHRKRTCRWDCLETRTLFGTLKTHMVSKIKFMSRTLFGTHRKRTCRVRLTTSLLLYSTRTKTHMSSKIALSFAHIKYGWRRGHTHRKRTLFGTLRKLTCQARLTTTHVLYSARTKLACQVWMTSCTLFSALRKRICQFRLTTSLTLCSARTENAHI